MKDNVRKKVQFSKNDTLAIKGLAILAMIQHHNFLSLERFEGYDVSFFPFSQSKVIILSNFLKICVGMYVFLSGYGLAFSVRKYSSDNTLNGVQYKDYLYRRLFKLMMGYWVIYAIFFIVSWIAVSRPMTIYFTDDIFSGIYSMFIDMTGLAYIFNTPTLNGTWWYMSLAIFIIAVVPFIAKLSKKYGAGLTILLCIFVPRIVSFGVQLTGEVSFNISRWFFAVVLGVVCAQYDVFAKAKSFTITKNKYLSKLIKFIKFIIYTALLVFLVYSRIYLHKNGFSKSAYELTDNFIPVFVVYYCYEFLTDIPVLRQVLMFLGKHSMNIFLLHTFIRQHLLKDFVYSFHHFALITLAVLIVSLAISVVIELLKKYTGFNKLVDLVDKKIAHRLSERTV